MPQNNIFCRKCNQKFKSMLSFRHHICPKEKDSVKWGVGSRKRSEETKILQQKDFDVSDSKTPKKQKYKSVIRKTTEESRNRS